MTKHALKLFKEYLLAEKLVLKRYNDTIAVTSDLEQRKDQSAETFKNKETLKKAGFKWDSNLNSWTISSDQLSHALDTINKINKIEAFVEKFENLPEFVLDTDNLSRKSEMAGKIDGYIERLTNELSEKAASEEITNFLLFQSKLKTRSINNAILIYIQRPNATHVEGFNTWKNKFGRSVKKGAKAIYIYAPVVLQKKQDKEIEDQALDDKSLDHEVKRKNVTGFIMVPVFDVSDTDAIPGKEHLYVTAPKWHADNTPSELADKIYNYARELSQELGINVTTDASKKGEMGYASGDHINISSNIAGVNRAGTMIHEIAHELLHFDKTSIFHIPEKLTKEEIELQAEAVSFVVLKHYGLPATHQTTYLALWKANADAIKKHAGVIKKVSDFIINRIDEIANREQPSTEPSINNESYNKLKKYIAEIINEINW